MIDPRQDRARWEKSIFIGVVVGIFVGALIGQIPLGILAGIVGGTMIDLDEIMTKVLNR